VTLIPDYEKILTTVTLKQDFKKTQATVALKPELEKTQTTITLNPYSFQNFLTNDPIKDPEPPKKIIKINQNKR